MENNIYETLLKKATEKNNLDYFNLEEPAYTIIHTALVQNMTEYLDYIGIPYTVFSLKNNKNDLILFGKKNFENMMEIEKGTRLRIGLEIQSKDDLKMAIYENNKLTGKRDMLSNIKGLTEYEAKRICELMEENHLVAVYKMYPDMTFEVSSHRKNRSKIQQYLLQAILEELNNSEQVQTRKYLYSQQLKIDSIYKSLENNELMYNVKIVSALNPDTYVQVELDGFIYYENGNARYSQPVTDTIKDRLDIAISLIDYPVVLNREEMPSNLSEKINQLNNEKDYSIQANTLLNNITLSDGVMVIEDSNDPYKETINDLLSSYEFFDEKAGVTLEYMLASDYGYDLNASIELANNRYITITDEVKDTNTAIANDTIKEDDQHVSEELIKTEKTDREEH